MKERPILFSAPMVRAIFEGRKTQTRRVMNPAPSLSTDSDGQRWWLVDFISQDRGFGWKENEAPFWVNCPYGVPGDGLWVKETLRWVPGTSQVAYAADCADYVIREMKELHQHWRPSIFMPRWASRITLEVTEVRVQRVQDISAADCFAEGISQTAPEIPKDPQIEFEKLWDRINAKRGFGWAVNPWVWALTFKRVSE